MLRVILARGVFQHQLSKAMRARALSDVLLKDMENREVSLADVPRHRATASPSVS